MLVTPSKMDKHAEETRLAPFSSGELEVHHVVEPISMRLRDIAYHKTAHCCAEAIHPVQSDIEFRFLGEMCKCVHIYGTANVAVIWDVVLCCPDYTALCQKMATFIITAMRTSSPTSGVVIVLIL
jgi:hypothetical protein